MSTFSDRRLLHITMARTRVNILSSRPSTEQHTAAIKRTRCYDNAGSNQYFELILPTSPMEPIALTLGQQFDIEQRSRDINAMTDVKQLQEISKDLLLAWQKEIARSRAAASPHEK